MNVDYLYSIVNLYLKKETENRKTILSIKKSEDAIEFDFNMNNNNTDKTNFVIPSEDFNNNIIDFINIYKEDLMIIDEKYTNNKVDGTCYYYVLFKNGRSISFNGFTILEMNNIRNILYDIKINREELRVTSIDEEKQMPYTPRLRLQQAGFSSYATLFLVVLFFADIFVIALWVFKIIFK